MHQGGGLIVGGCGYRWQAISGKPLSEHPANHLLANFGILITAGRCESVGDAGLEGVVAFDVDVDAALCDTTSSLKQLARAARGPPEADPEYPERFRCACDSILRAMAALPRSLKLRLPAMDGEAVRTTPLPSPAEPLRLSDRAAVAALLVARLAPQGEPSETVPPSGLSTLVAIDLEVPGLHSTGVYAPADAAIEVTLNAAKWPRGRTISCLIGCNTGQLPVSCGRVLSAGARRCGRLIPRDAVVRAGFADVLWRFATSTGTREHKPLQPHLHRYPEAFTVRFVIWNTVPPTPRSTRQGVSVLLPAHLTFVWPHPRLMPLDLPRRHQRRRR